MTVVQPIVAFIGTGNMAEALIAALRSGPRHDCAIVVADVDARKAAEVAGRHRAAAAASNREAVANADWVVLCTKPSAVLGIAAEVGTHTKADACIISVAAGITTASIEHALDAERAVLRVMPNLPVAIGEGVIATSRGTRATDEDMRRWVQMFADAGTLCEVPEQALDVVTALAGSGPAFVLLVIESLADAAVREGLDADTALRFATQTALGAARWQQTTGESPAALRARVTSPNGTTERGLFALENGGLRRVMQEAISAATARAKELAQTGAVPSG